MSEQVKYGHLVDLAPRSNPTDDDGCDAITASPQAGCSYVERIAAGLCPDCAKPYGLLPNERHRLPRIDCGDRWEFLAPCGHPVFGIAKGGLLAKRYGF